MTRKPRGETRCVYVKYDQKQLWAEMGVEAARRGMSFGDFITEAIESWLPFSKSLPDAPWDSSEVR